MLDDLLMTYYAGTFAAAVKHSHDGMGYRTGWAKEFNGFKKMMPLTRVGLEDRKRGDWVVYRSLSSGIAELLSKPYSLLEQLHLEHKDTKEPTKFTIPSRGPDAPIRV
jgi:hypothetical protein